MPSELSSRQDNVRMGFVPKLFTVLHEGYGLADFRRDALAGLTVAIVALPLAMALAIASGTTPEKGLITAAVAGFLISALGGSRVQIGGPTGAFVVIVFDVIQRHGYDGLLLATAMAGLMLVACGWMRFGEWIKYIPEPVVTGFTAGIAVIIFSSQIRDLFGLQMAQVPGPFFEKWEAFWSARGSASATAVLVAVGALTVIVALRRWAPRAPGFLIAVIGAALVVFAFGLPADTIGARFGEIPGAVPTPSLPAFTAPRLVELLPSAFTIAFLAGLESLLSAMVADGMSGGRHRPNAELVAQGVANVASAAVGGLPATGAIARTATNVRSGGRTPVAGMLHAAFVLAAMLALGPLAAFVPMASLAAVLVVVAWNMSEREKFARLLRGPRGDRIVLLITFGLTVAVDLNVAIAVGVSLACLMFMHRMAEATALQRGAAGMEIASVDDARPAEELDQRDRLPAGVEVFRLHGPLFFGVAGRLDAILEQIGQTPRAVILRLRLVPMVDASGGAALAALIERCRKRGAVVVLSGPRPEVVDALKGMGIDPRTPGVAFARDFAHALELVDVSPVDAVAPDSLRAG